MKRLIKVKKDKPRVFQVLLLDNDENEVVEVEEAEHVNFDRVEKHLAHGGSVFVTSRRSQKLGSPKGERNHQSKKMMGKITLFH